MGSDRVWRHKVRGSIYTVIGEMDGIVYYISHADGRKWWRPFDEFYDGRFERVDTEPLSAADLGFERG